MRLMPASSGGCVRIKLPFVGLGVWDGRIHTAMFKIDNQEGSTV